MKLDFSLIDNIIFDGIDHGDMPDYSDAFITSCDYDGREVTEEELDFINVDAQFVYDSLMNYLY